tara:strand:+ start:1521 stop:3563 length:2043 start_codon:yes stop_codon:yes gene_type:complete
VGISKWNAGIVRPVPVAPTGSYQNSSAPGVWTVDQQAYWQKQGLWPTPGNVDPSAFIENLFSTYLYTGNGSTQTITNGINLSGNGGLTWIKSRTNTSGGETSHVLVDTVRGSSKWLASEATSSETTNVNLVTGFTTSGFSVGNAPYWGNENAIPYASWTFREQPKFFDIVTYSGNNAAQTIAHNLASTPGCVIIKCTNVGGTSWWVRHRSVPGNAALLNSTTGFAFNINDMPAVSSTALSFSSGASTNNSGETYVAYLFAHDAGGFGLTGTDNVISCGSFTNSGSTVNINLGYEAQFVLMKKSSGTGNWFLFDTMRGLSQTSFEFLYPNLSNAAEFKDYQGPYATATGFSFNPVNNGQFTTGDYIYIAIRRGPMAVPTLGTSVFSPIARTGTGATANVTGVGFPPDLVIPTARTVGWQRGWYDRLRGVNQSIASNSTGAELTTADSITVFGQDGATYGTEVSVNASTYTFANWFMRRAPGFFDEVCYTGTGSATTFTHNLTVVPEMMIVKRRSGSADWPVYHVAMGPTKYTFLDGSTELTGTMWNNTAPTSSVFSVDGSYYVNNAASTYVAYLFATCPGVSKVGSYTGTNALQTVACGFTSGARFVLIHRIDSGSNSWYVWDSARGITSGNDPYLQINNTAAEVTGTNYVDTDTTGFKVTAAAPAALNAVGGTYIFLAIA